MTLVIPNDFRDTSCHPAKKYTIKHIENKSPIQEKFTDIFDMDINYIQQNNTYLNFKNFSYQSFCGKTPQETIRSLNNNIDMDIMSDTFFKLKGTPNRLKLSNMLPIKKTFQLVNTPDICIHLRAPDNKRNRQIINQINLLQNYDTNIFLNKTVMLISNNLKLFKKQKITRDICNKGNCVTSNDIRWKKVDGSPINFELNIQDWLKCVLSKQYIHLQKGTFQSTINTYHQATINKNETNNF